MKKFIISLGLFVLAGAAYTTNHGIVGFLLGSVAFTFFCASLYRAASSVWNLEDRSSEVTVEITIQPTAQ